MPKSPEKMREVKERIFRAAMELFQEKGHENTSVAEITQRAGVSKGTFFTHFPSKDSIFGAVGKILIDYMEEEVENQLKIGASTKEILRKNIQIIANWCINNRELVQQVVVSGIYKPAMTSTATPNRVKMSEILANVLQIGQEKCEVSKEIHVEDVVSVIMGTYFMVMYDWMENNMEWSLEEKMNHCFELILRGIRP